MCAIDIAWDAGKLFLQFLGGLAIAWLAVRWALARFKSEKIWERRFAAQVDIVAALSELRRYYGVWIDEIEGSRSITAQAAEDRSDRFKAASRKLEEASALGAMLLPEATTELLKRLENERAQADWKDDPYEKFSANYGALDKAIGELIEFGRAEVAKR